MSSLARPVEPATQRRRFRVLRRGVGVVAWLGLVSCSDPAVRRPAARSEARPGAGAYVQAKRCVAPAVTQPRRLVPDPATLVVEVDADRLFASSAFARTRPVLEGDADIAKMLGSLKSCSIALRDLETIVVATGPADGLLVVVEGKDVGNETSLQCVSDALRGNDPDPPWRIESGRCATELTMSGGDARGIVLDADTLAIASRPWLPAVRDRIAGKGRSAMHHSLSWTKGRVDTTDPAWFAFEAGPLGGMTGSSVSSGIRRVGGSMDLASGVSVELTAGYASPTEAKAAHAELEQLVDQLKAIVPMLGVSKAVADSVKLSRKGVDVGLQLSGSLDDIEALVRKMTGLGSSASSKAPTTAEPLRPGI